MKIKTIQTRNWDFLPFDRTRIERAIEKAAHAINKIDLSFIDRVVDLVIEKLIENLNQVNSEYIVSVEWVQDIVEKQLMNVWEYDVAKAYIIYRNKRIKQREEEKQRLLKKIESNSLKIIKSNWKKELFSIEKIRNTYARVSFWLARICKFEELEDSLKKYIVEWMTTSDITKILIKSCIDLISIENSSWQYIAWRISTLDLYKQASKNRNFDLNDIYKPEVYKEFFDDYIKRWLYYKDFYKYYTKEDILKAWKHLKKSTDLTYNYNTILNYKKRYFLNPNNVIRELPQEMYMSIALFLAIPEKDSDRLEIALKIYEYCSTWKISLPTPTILNARTNYNQLSSCFKLNIDDDLRSIYHNVENMAQISKFWWWVWVYLWNIRSKGWSIRWVKWVSGWVNPWVKVINDTAIAVNQLGSRAWAISVTLDIWHRDIYDFLDLQTETWDSRRKAFDIFPAVSIPDLFLERVQKNENWTLFDPKEIKDFYKKSLQDNFSKDFNKFYLECEKNDKLELKVEVKAKDLFKKFLKTTVETGMPYVFFRDTVNRLNPNKHAWNIYATQLCTEICQNTSPSKFIEETIEDWVISIKYEAWDTVVCNLTSINVAKVNTKEEIKKIMPYVMRILDNVIELNYYPIKEAEQTAKKYRSVWVWFLWLAEYLAVNKIAYDSKEAREKVDELMETFAYFTFKNSNILAKQRWAYELFEWSDWSKWIILAKDKKWFKNNSKTSLDWSKLIDSIKRNWLRFAYHLAPAPNTSTAWVVWTTAALLPIYKKYFVETNKIAPTVVVAPNLNSENFWFYKEYINMDLNDVIDMMSVVYKWIDQSASFEWIINPAKVAPIDLYNYYLKAWKQWIKTVYYVRSMSLDVKECVSCSW